MLIVLLLHCNNRIIKYLLVLILNTIKYNLKHMIFISIIPMPFISLIYCLIDSYTVFLIRSTLFETFYLPIHQQ
jgi:hypothetical protein